MELLEIEAVVGRLYLTVVDQQKQIQILKEQAPAPPPPAPDPPTPA